MYYYYDYYYYYYYYIFIHTYIYSIYIYYLCTIIYTHVIKHLCFGPSCACATGEVWVGEGDHLWGGLHWHEEAIWGWHEGLPLLPWDIGVQWLRALDLRHVEAYLATTYPPAGVEQAVASGLLGSPLLGTSTRVTADWCHAWSLLGQWSGLVTFPVPASGIWPRHGHLRKILDGYQGRQPNFHKWARPAYEQGALPTLSLLPGEVSVRVLPGDKMYQATMPRPASCWIFLPWNHER